jgi:HCO3- transporter family
MTFIGPTGLTLAFMTALYGFTSAMALPFLPVYSWCGLWTSGFMVLLSLGGASNLIRYATQFTDDVFNALLAVNFIYEASRSLLRNFSMPGMNKSGAFLALNMALTTYICTKKTVQARQSRYFNEEIREFLRLVLLLYCCVCCTTFE